LEGKGSLPADENFLKEIKYKQGFISGICKLFLVAAVAFFFFFPSINQPLIPFLLQQNFMTVFSLGDFLSPVSALVVWWCWPHLVICEDLGKSRPVNRDHVPGHSAG